MIRSALLICMAALCGTLVAQSDRTITLRMIDGRTGRPIQTQSYLVRVDHQDTIHADWAIVSEEGVGKLVVPRGPSLLSVRATPAASNNRAASRTDNVWFS